MPYDLEFEEPLAELRSRDVDGQVTIEAGSLLPRNDGSDGGTYVGRRHGFVPWPTKRAGPQPASLVPAHPPAPPPSPWRSADSVH